MAHPIQVPTLTSGSRLGTYEIVARLGAGGMGEVYLATDTNLGRQVAIKVLPASLNTDPERIARFRREAQVLAALNHPHIAAIYGTEEANGIQFLILELAEGETLDQRIARRALAVDEALAIAKQIAEALEAAHEKGIIHRDLKPSTIALTNDGQVKVLDFGLAKLVATDSALTSPSASLSPTITSPALLTGAGMLLGTAAYMSPEQATGGEADKRSDVWAFGCVLYEMLTRSRPFNGNSMTEVLGAVVGLEPDWEALSSDVPPAIRTLIQRSLVKNRRLRIGDIAVARFVFEGQTHFPQSGSGSGAMQLPLRRRIVPLLGGALVTLALAGAGVWYFSRAAPEPRHVMRFTQLLDADSGFTRLGRPLVAISPDGTQTVFVANLQLYIRRAGNLKAVPIVGTNTDPNTPFFSPDGQWIGYWSFRDSKLMRVPSAGGAPVSIAAADIPFGASWGADGTIVFGQTTGIMRVSANGGTPQLVVKTAPGEQVHGPQLLPDSRTLLFTMTTATGPTRWDQADIVVQPLSGGQRKTIWRGGSDAQFVASGHIVYALQQTLLAMPFDLSRLTRTGAPVAIVEDILRAEGPATAAANYAISESGTLVYVPAIAGATRRSIMALDAAGNGMPVVEAARNYVEPQISPDGQRIAVTVVDPASGSHIWIIDTASGVANPLTFEGSNTRPAWTPDGKSVVFRSSRTAGTGTLLLQAADSSSAARQLVGGTNELQAGNISKTGVLAFYKEVDGSPDLYTLALPDGNETKFLATRANERTPAISPDGRWIAYVSNERGRDDVYVRPYPASGSSQWLLSDAGGYAPQWSPAGSAVYYISPSGMLMSVNVETRTGFVPQRPKELFRTGRFVVISTNNRPYGVHPDGRLIFVAHQGDGAEISPPRINVVINWFEELKRLVPSP